MSEVLSGEVRRVTYENEETQFRVIKVEVPKRGLVTLVGKFQAVGQGTHVRVTGEFQRDATRGEQFQVHTLMLVEPDTLPAIEKYLGSGMFAGIGPGFAKRIVAEFGLDTLRVLDQQPERLAEVNGLGPARADEIRSRWREQRAFGSLSILLQGHGIGVYLAKRIFDRYGDRSAAIVQGNPYRLALEVRGVGFRTADAIAMSFGISKDHPERAQAGTHHVLVNLSERGHIYALRGELCAEAAEMLGIDAAHTESAVDALRAREHLIIEEDRVYLSALFHSERSLSAHLARLQGGLTAPLPGVELAIADFEQRLGYALAEAQCQALRIAAGSALTVITGGPGVGKTTLVRALLRLFEGAKLETLLAAPTGRAAKRLCEATSRPASTLHRLLEYDPKLRTFQRREEAPLSAQAYVIDEASMIDLQLAESFFAAVPSGARVVIVGDANQLPSVGPGAVLRDLIDSHTVQVVKLNQIFRQAQQSRIVQNAHRILEGEEPIGAPADSTDADFYIVERKDPEAALKVIEELVTQRIPRRFSLNPREDVQVLSPMHRGLAGTESINQRLQQLLNGNGPAITRRGVSYRAGDRVMQLRNDYDRGVFNGDLGKIRSVDVENGELVAEFEERPVKYTLADLDDLTLAYATSIHKSQGSEYPAVVIPFLTSHFVMLSRNLLYTAVTRGRRLCVLVSDPRAVRLALSELRKDVRATTLVQRLQSAVRL